MTSTAAPAFAAKMTARDDVTARIVALQRPLVFTNGVFDILHRGHVTYLDRARGLGASLVVGINTDASARALNKGVDRPVNPLGERMAVVAALESVTLVVAFEEETPLDLVLQCHPNIIVKGGDYDAATTVGAAEVIAWGGRFEAIPLLAGRSTSALLTKIRS